MNKRKAFIPITALMAALLLALVAAMTPFVAERDVAHAQVNTDSKLASLSLSAGELTPAFVNTTYEYAATVPHSKSSINVTARANITGATVEIYTGTDAQITPGDSGTIDAGATRRNASNIPLGIGSTYIGVKVTALNGTGVTVYEINVTRLQSGLSSAADMTAMTVVDSANESVAVSPPVKKNVTSYTARVANDEGSVTITPTVSANATFVITSDRNSTRLTDAGSMSLSVGKNVITIKVTAQNLVAKKTYKLTVTRVGSNASDDARLKGLTLSGLTLSPPFDINRTSTTYTVNAPHTKSQTIVTPTVNQSGAEFVITPVDFNTGTTAHDVVLGVGTTAISIVVTAEDVTATKTYSVNITRAPAGASSNAKLSALTIENGTPYTLSPGFDKDDEDYSVRVPNSQDFVDINATAENAGARPVVTVESGRTAADDDDTTNNTLANLRVTGLKEGENVIKIKVTAADLVATKTYTVTVTRAPANASDDARLGALMVGSASVNNVSGKGTLSTATAPTTPDYSTGVGNSVSSIKIDPTSNDSNAIVNIFSLAGATAIGHDVGSPVGTDGMVNLSVGRNLVRIQVTAENGSTFRNYFVEITRASAGVSGNAKLAAAGLSLDTDLTDNTATTASAITLSPGFKPDDEIYTALVATGVTSVEVVATAEQTAARPVVTVESGRTADADGDTTANIAAQDVTGLKVGGNVITVTVTAADLVTTKTYTVTVTRAAANASDDASLSALMVGSESVNVSGKGTLSTATAPTTPDHSTGVGNSVNSIEIDPTTNHSGAAVSIFSLAGATAIGHDVGTPVGADGMVNLSVGRNLVRIQVTAENGSTFRNYFVEITRASATAKNDAKLDTLTLSSVVLDQVFNENTGDYTAEVPVNIASTTVTATADATATKVEISSDRDDDIGDDLDDTNAANITEHTIDLLGGDNVITITVTAQDYVTTKTYTVRIVSGESTDTRLSDLSLTTSAGAVALKDKDGMTVSFADDTMMYYASVVDQAEINVAATAVDSDASVSGGGAVSLAVGENTVTVTVTAEDGTTTGTYTVMVTRTVTSVSDVMLDRYDANDNGKIDLDEVNDAIDDFFDPDITLTLDDLNTVIDLFFGAGS